MLFEVKILSLTVKNITGFSIYFFVIQMLSVNLRPKPYH
jgi:hypothetical protein